MITKKMLLNVELAEWLRVLCRYLYFVQFVLSVSETSVVGVGHLESG